MTKALNDPYSVYYSKEEVARHHESLAKERVGIGNEFMIAEGQVIIVAALQN